MYPRILSLGSGLRVIESVQSKMAVGNWFPVSDSSALSFLCLGYLETCPQLTKFDRSLRNRSLASGAPRKSRVHGNLRDIIFGLVFALSMFLSRRRCARLRE